MISRAFERFLIGVVLALVGVTDERGIFRLPVRIGAYQVTGQLGPGGQPRFSRDSIAEFQFISNRFDASHEGTTDTKGKQILVTIVNFVVG
jgi:hypothetical protein